jgi:hypothetical protein
MQVGQFFVPAPDIGVGRSLRHFAAMQLTLTMIGHLIGRHGQLQLASGRFVMLTVSAMPVKNCGANALLLARSCTPF